ncbi:MAG: STAS domain-containing protein [Mycobacteriales bacterium]
MDVSNGADVTPADVVGCVGDAKVAELGAAPSDIMDIRPTRLRMDMQRAIFLHHTGAAALTAAAHILRVLGASLVITGASDAARRMLSRTGLSRLLAGPSPEGPAA